MSLSVAICYPPLKSSKGIPLLSQNRQFQWFQHPTYIYPMGPASAATVLKKQRHQVFWLDGIAEGHDFPEWLKIVKHIQPDLLILESKTPVIKLHWQIIHQLKTECSWKTKIVLVGDHVTALPQESLENSPVDYVITGGDFDFLLAELCNYLDEKTDLPPGI